MGLSWQSDRDVQVGRSGCGRPAVACYSQSVKPSSAPVLIVAASALSYLLAAAIGLPVLVPFLNALAAFPFMIGSLAPRRCRRSHSPDAGLGGRARHLCNHRLVPGAGRDVPAVLARRRVPQGNVSLRHDRTGSGGRSSASSFHNTPGHAALFSCPGACIRQSPRDAARRGPDELHGVLRRRARSGQPPTDPGDGRSPGCRGRSSESPVSSYSASCLSGPVLARVFGFSYRLRDQRRWLGWAVTGW